MSDRLILVDKRINVRLVGFIETWRLLFAKILIKVTGPEITMACQDDQLCAGLEAGIYGTVHGVSAIWDKKATTVDSVILLVEEKKEFNEINIIVLLQKVFH